MLNRIRKAAAAFRSGPNITVDQLDKLILDLEIGQETASGVNVSVRSGARQATVYACINILSRDKAALPLTLFEKTLNGGREKVRSHEVSEFLANPNPAMTAFQFRRTAWAHQHAWGQSFARIKRSRRGEVVAWLLDPDTVQIGVNSAGRKIYRQTLPDGTTEDFRDNQILHRFGLSFDGLQGISPIRHCMEAVGTAIALGEYGASYFQSPVPRVIATHPTGFKDDGDARKFREGWNESYSGKKGLKTIAVLPKGMEVAQVVKIPNEEAQFIESRKLAKEEIAQLYTMPMHRLQALDRATFSNIEHQDLEYAKYTLLPDLVAEEQALEQALLLPEERETLFIRHNMDALLRGDFKSRMEGHSTGINAGFLTRNEAREHEDLPRIAGLDEPIVPKNMGPASQLGKEPPAKQLAAEE